MSHELRTPLNGVLGIAEALARTNLDRRQAQMLDIIRDSGGAIKCQQISGGDGFATMADGSQIYMFAFGPLSGLVDLRAGMPATEPASIFNQVGDMPAILGSADANDPVGSPQYQTAIANTTYNGAIGLVPDPMLVQPLNSSP